MLGSLPRPRARSAACALAATAVTAGLVTVVPASPAQAAAQATPQATPQATAQARPWPGHPDRSLRRYVVRSGDTATELAVRYHAWTAELIAFNRLGRGATLRRGQVIWIPVVVSAAQKARPRKAHVRKKRLPALLHARTPAKGWRHADLTRAQVRDLVVRMSRRYGVPPRLALAIAWQESGWQQRRVSSAGAIGVMQVMPDTGRWMRWYAGRPLRLRDTHDNVWAGVLTLRTLRAWTKRDITAIAAYYQGLGAVRRRGWFDETLLYVRAVLAHHRRLSRH